MERYCGLIRPAIKSRKHPFASLDRYIVESAQILQIQLVYNIEDPTISLHPRKKEVSLESGLSDPACTYSYLIDPSLLMKT